MKQVLELDVLRVLFSGGFEVRQTLEKNPSGKVILGKGIFEKHLEDSGFPKSELRKLVKQGILLKVTTRYQDSWRNTYVLPTDKQESI